MHVLTSSHLRQASLAVALVVGISGCQQDEPRPAPHVVTELKGSVAERIVRARGMLRLSPELAATILDAHALEDRVGDGRLGPSDFTTFITLRVAPRDVALWRAQLTPIIATDDHPLFAEPAFPMPWWLQAPEFASLELFAPDRLTGRTNGWIAVNAASGTIFIYTFTT